jgi:hypothetical protein
MSLGTIRVLQHHYRIIEELLLQGLDELEVVKSQYDQYLDAGYIVVDLDQHLVINAQVAFQIPLLPDMQILNIY